jgi:hypothetical protein
MATDTASDDTPVLTDRERWDGEVIAQTRFRYRWGTHEYPAELQVFDDDEGHLTVLAPSDPPPDAEAIVAGGLAAGAAAESVAAILAEEWGIDVEAVATDGVAPADTEEVPA